MSPYSLAGACCWWLAGGASFGPIFHNAQMAKRPNLCFRFGELFPRVLELKRVFWGLWFHLASQVMFIYGLGSLSGKNPRQNLDTDKVLLLNFS